jgi:hypothetical protein
MGAALAALLLGLAGCAVSRPALPALRESDYPGLIRSPTVLGADVLLQQRITASWGDGRERGFDAALQTQGEQLTLIGLSPMGSTAFVVLLRGTDLEHRNQTAEELPFPPRFIVIDVQRVFFPWLARAGQRLPDGEHTGEIGDERIVERIAAGRLVERRFSRLDGEPAGEIIVRYEWDRPAAVAPSRAELDNGWFGYRLTIETNAETLLTPTSEASR